MKCWKCGAENTDGLPRCAVCGAELQAVMATVVEEGDSTGGVIPYKNPKALLAYYLGILSGLPLIGLPIGIVALVLGVQGLQARKRNPVIKGSIHAGIGIGCGCFFSLFWSLVIAGIAMAIFNQK